ncbi:HAD-IIIA family hydrolase [bacterium]|nr:HAD-IIIA family hydrolase [bacterium]
MVLPSSISWIAFDAVGTLITPQPSVAEAYTRVGQRHGSQLDCETVRARFRSAFAASQTACFPPERRGQTSEGEEWSRWQWIVSEVLPDVQDPEGCFQELWDHFADPQHWAIYPEVTGVITELQRRGYRCAIASNFDARLHGLLKSLPVLADCGPCLVSSEVGYRKPAEGFYRTLLERCEAAPPELLMVGDDFSADVEAPRALGMSAIWLNRHTLADDAVLSLHDLLEFLPGGAR